MRSIDLKETAKIIRAALKAAFPETKFSVRCQFYSCGQHIEVSYTDGPPAKAVEAITNQFYGTGFDGMTDSTTHHNSEFFGETVKFAGSRPGVTHNRTNEDELIAAIRSELKGHLDWNERSPDWMILGRMDMRWETPQRAVAKYFAGERS